MELYGSEKRYTLEALAHQVWEAAVTGNETTVGFIRNFQLLRRLPMNSPLG